MKTEPSILKSAKLAFLAVLMASMGVSCSTVYDAYGRPRTVVEPGAALLGVAAAGVAGYALGNHNSHDDGRHYRSSRQYSSYRGHRSHNSYYY